MNLTLQILGTPQPKQSVRSRVAKTKNGKAYVQHYQTADVKRNEKNIAFDVKSQLPAGFIPFSGAIHVKKLLYVFAPQKNWPKYKLNELKQGKVFYKDVKPDLTDNLNKPLFDALQGIVYLNDSQICKISNVEKIYGEVPRIEIEFETL
ncbi:RusA family crossover junction endodeoxyribonuclease [Chryseobacterium sp. SG20098]|uniref:RusA family crossover junction endodeoxyribonuclease n=1 Tax=Chryseobacterium sp. SG20098 TaxID=3074145 RepID=UPI00288339A2|nr:RusA family crossover junction endodeoxyribonuclease [Chryseobacterium sp. SG20098]WNI34675.1 RusA family crossover junction endodeoxyribonuclease [Chryseobacterium sp. SG20098]